MIRPAALADATADAGLIAGMGGHDDASEPDIALTLGAALGSPSWRALVADEGGEVAGYVEVHARPAVLHGRRQAWLAALAVAPAWQRKGLGRDLLNAADREAALLGCVELVVESSTFRDCAHGFYRSAGFEEYRPALRFRRDVEIPSALTMEGRFVALAARAASAVEAAVAGLADAPAVGLGADGAPTEAADRAAEEAAAAILSQLGVPLVSEESGLLGPGSITAGEPWICIDPLDGSRNFRAGLAPYATSFGLVLDGRPLAGFVMDLSSGRRWWAARGQGAWVDGRPARTRRRPVAVQPSPAPGTVLTALDGYERVRVSGSTTVDLCRVADGSAGAFVDLARGVVHVHDLAGPLAVLTEAGAGVASPDGDLVLAPDPTRCYRVVAAYDGREAARLCGVAGTTLAG